MPLTSIYQILTFRRKKNISVTCKDVYTTVAVGSGAALFASLIPGASSITNIAGKVIL